ncbi:hypothetical protein D0O32_33285, partial [Pseudomonas aeruginosa]
YPVGKQGDVFTAELRVTRMPCLGLNDGPVLQHKETCSFQVATMIRLRQTTCGARSSTIGG